MNDDALEERLRRRPRPQLPPDLRERILATEPAPVESLPLSMIWSAAAALLLCALLASYDRRPPQPTAGTLVPTAVLLRQLEDHSPTLRHFEGVLP